MFGSWLGWLVELDRPVAFVVDDTVDRADLVRRTLVVGHDAIAGVLDGGIEAWRAAGRPTAAVPLLRSPIPGTRVLDVRQDAEWRAGHVPGAVHVALGRLPEVGEALDPAVPTTVMCGHGERAMTGASILERLGHDRVTVFAGGPDDWAAATRVDLVSGP